MLGILGIVVSLLLLMTLAYRGMNVLVLAPLMSLLAVSLGGEAPLLATYTQVYMESLGGYLVKYFPLFMLGSTYLQLADAAGISPDLLHRVASMASGAFDTLPHNGAVITLLAITQLTHRNSYLDILMVAVVVSAFATIAIIILGSLLGSF